MKKLIVILLMCTSQQLHCQFDIMLGACKYSIDTKESANFGLDFAISWSNFYLGVSSNMSSGDGEYLAYSSSYSYATNKVYAGSINFGYDLPLIDQVYITPILGYAMYHDIYQDPVGWLTYYNGPGKDGVNLGVMLKFLIKSKGGIYIQAGTFERIKGGGFIRLNL